MTANLSQLPLSVKHLVPKKIFLLSAFEKGLKYSVADLYKYLWDNGLSLKTVKSRIVFRRITIINSNGNRALERRLYIAQTGK